MLTSCSLRSGPVIDCICSSMTNMRSGLLNNLLTPIHLSNCVQSGTYKCRDKRTYFTISGQSKYSSAVAPVRCTRTIVCYENRSVNHYIDITSSYNSSNNKGSNGTSSCDFSNECKERLFQIPKYCNQVTNRMRKLQSEKMVVKNEDFNVCTSEKVEDQNVLQINPQIKYQNGVIIKSQCLTSRKYLCSNHTHLLQNRKNYQLNYNYQIRKFSHFNCFWRRNDPTLNRQWQTNHYQRDVDGFGVRLCVQKRTNYMNNWNGPEYRKQPPWRVLFFGTDSIALDTLKALHDNMKYWSPVVGSLDVVTVESQKPVREYAESHGLPVHGWPLKTDNSRYDVGVLVSFGHMIPDRVIHMFPYGILNMHPSLLPRWRGASPIIHAVLSGDTEMGVSVTEIRPKHFDIGPLLMQRGFPMPHRPTSMELADILGKIGANMILETLQDLPTLERFEHEQDLTGVTYAHKISKQNGYIDWTRSTAEDIDRHYRALSEIVAIRTKWKDHIVSLYDVVDPLLLKDAKHGLHPRYNGDIDTAPPGTPAWHRKLDCIVIKCKEGLIGFRRLKLRQMLTPKDFHNGYLNAWDGTCFTSVDNELYKFVRSEKLPASSRA